MGRLTDDILAMFGVKPSDRVYVAKKANDADSPEIPLVFPTREQIIAGETEKPNNVETPEIPLMFPTREQIISGGETPAVDSEEDCLSCKVVGCSVLSGAAGAVLYAMKRNSPNFSGRKLYLYRAQAISIAGVLLMLAGCRWFNTGVFDKANANVSMLDQTKGDLRKLFVFFNVEPPKVLDTQAKT